MRHFAAALVFVLVGASFPMFASTARACSPLTCESQLILPAFTRGSDIPGNAVVFKTGRGFGHEGTAPPRILSSSGVEVPASAKKPEANGVPTVFSADETLTPGVYQLEYDARCIPFPGFPYPLPEPAMRTVTSFRVGPPEAPPASAGSLEITERGTFGETGTFVRLQLQPSPEMYPYLSLAHWSLMVDGKPYRVARAQAPDPTVVTLDCSPGHSPSGPDSCGSHWDVGPGPHHVVLSAYLPGIEGALPAELTVDVPCGALMEDGGVEDSGVVPPGPTVECDIPAPPGPPRGGCDCAVGADVSSARGWSLVCVASMVGLALRARRRRR